MTAAPARSATVEPTRPVSKLWVVWLSLASLGVWSGIFGPIQVLLAQQAEAIDPHHKAEALAVVSGVGALFSTVLNPVWGALSDRTVLRMGRRLPWVLGGLVGGILAMVILSQAGSVLTMVVGWALAQSALNAMLAALNATVPDQVPVLQRGAVGGWMALAQTVGVVAGSGVAAATGSLAAGYLTIAGMLAVLALPYCFDSRDLVLARADRESFDLGRFVRSFWISPREHPDFGWAWLTRFLVNLGNALVILYLFYYLRDVVGLSSHQAAGGVFMLTATYGACTVLTAVGAGMWSDRLGRRKVFVIASGLICACALFMLACVPTMVGAFVGAVLLGIGFGAYQAVDFAMITQVLPSAEDRAKDLGVINIANALPQVLAPVVAGGMLAIGLGYNVVFLFAALASVLGSVLVRRIRSLV